MRADKCRSRPVSRVLDPLFPKRVTDIRLGLPLPAGSSGRTRRSGAGHSCLPCGRRLPIRPCFRWGLACRPCHQGRGALLPHPFTLTGPRAGGLLSVPLSVGLPRLAVSQHPALRSPDFASRGSSRNTTGVRPDDFGVAAITRKPRAMFTREKRSERKRGEPRWTRPQPPPGRQAITPRPAAPPSRVLRSSPSSSRRRAAPHPP